MLLLFFGIIHHNSAQTCTATTSNDWDKIVWSCTGGATIATATTVLIPAGRTATIPNGNTTFNGRIEVSGTLDIKGKLVMSASSTIIFNTGSNLIATGPGKSDKITIGNVTISDDEINAITTPNTLDQGNLATGGSGTTAAPVELLYFTAEMKNRQVLLSWATSSEKNFDFFTVERSKDLKTWTALGDVTGGGYSTSILNYQFSDATHYAGMAYYRLKATDYDGTIEYHKVISINLVGTDQVSVYPNPGSGESFNLETSYDAPDGEVKIINLYGKEIYKDTVVAGKNHFNLVQPLESGIYLVVIKQGGQEQKLKLQVN